MKISLVGFMGAGKTTCAKLLAEKTGLQCVEIDDRIVELSGRSSPQEIFEQDGEPRFRELEAKACREQKETKRGIISTGGGVVLNPDNIDALRSEGGAIVYLNTSYREVANRMRGISDRPLWKDPDETRALYESRLPLYEEYSDKELLTDGLTPMEVASKICELFGIS